MKEDSQRGADVDRFITDLIDSVPHLEALLLLWRERPEIWSAESLAKRLWVKPDVARDILQDLVRERLIVVISGSDEFSYQPDPEREQLLGSLNAIYREEMIRISTMIHSKPSSAVREFARAFRLKKEQK
jgi:hypothetical protein